MEFIKSGSKSMARSKSYRMRSSGSLPVSESTDLDVLTTKNVKQSDSPIPNTVNVVFASSNTGWKKKERTEICNDFSVRSGVIPKDLVVVTQKEEQVSIISSDTTQPCVIGNDTTHLEEQVSIINIDTTQACVIDSDSTAEELNGATQVEQLDGATQTEELNGATQVEQSHGATQVEQLNVATTPTIFLQGEGEHGGEIQKVEEKPFPEMESLVPLHELFLELNG